MRKLHSFCRSSDTGKGDIDVKDKPRPGKTLRLVTGAFDGQRDSDSRVTTIAEAHLYVCNSFLLGSSVCVSMQLGISFQSPVFHEEREAQNHDDLP